MSYADKSDRDDDNGRPDGHPDGRPEGLSSGTNKWNGRTLVHHPVCDPTTPATVAAGGLCLDQWSRGSEGRLGMLAFQWLCIVPGRQEVDGNQVESGCFGVEMSLPLCAIGIVLQLICLRLMGGVCI